MGAVSLVVLLEFDLDEPINVKTRALTLQSHTMGDVVQERGASVAHKEDQQAELQHIWILGHWPHAPVASGAEGAATRAQRR